ncbi:T9SS type A sorting domain-containing protein [bacterium]|nr:T9SS type A sorting domain-containing protein [bacterium]
MLFVCLITTALFVNFARADLHDTANSADYIILTSQEVLDEYDWIQDLLDYRAGQGRTVMAVSVEEIWAEFTPAGSDTAIRDFLHYAHQNWQPPQLKDVFIIGHTDIVPSHPLEQSNSVEALSDYFYALPEGSEDYSPRFALGRLPWRSDYPSSLNDFGAKIQSYEQSQIGDWARLCHLIADSNCGWTQDCEEYIEPTMGEHLPAGIGALRDYLGRPVGDPWAGSREEVILNLNEGSLFTCYYGITSGYEILPDGPITSEDFASMTNLEHLTFFVGTITNALGADSIDEIPFIASALNAPFGGMIAAVANSGVGWVWSGGAYDRRFMNELFAESNQTIGGCWTTCCTYYADSMAVPPPFPSSTWDTLLGHFLLGDPATIIPGRGTSVDPIASPVVPTQIEIVGNYPNPFNPATTIRFMLNRAGNARLTAYDVTGRTVGTLADNNFTSGEHSVLWSPVGLASGTYLVRLESAGQFATHRVILLK